MKKIIIGAVTAMCCCFAQNSELVRKSIHNCENGLTINNIKIDTVGKFASFTDIKEMSLRNITKGNAKNINSFTFLKNGLIENDKVFVFDTNFDENFINNIMRIAPDGNIACIRNFSNTSIYDDTDDDGNTVIKILYPKTLDLETQNLMKSILSEMTLFFWINLSQGAFMIGDETPIDIQNKVSLNQTLKILIKRNSVALENLQVEIEKDKQNQIKNVRDFGLQKINQILKYRENEAKNENE